MGRFLSEDPIGFRGGDTNFYRYVGNNPVCSNDPSGNLGIGVVAGITFAAAWVIDDMLNKGLTKSGSLAPGKSNDTRLDMYTPGDQKYDQIWKDKKFRKFIEKTEDDKDLPVNSCRGA